MTYAADAEDARPLWMRTDEPEVLAALEAAVALLAKAGFTIVGDPAIWREVDAVDPVTLRDMQLVAEAIEHAPAHPSDTHH